MEEKMLEILMNIQKDVSELKENQKEMKEDIRKLKEDISELKEGQRVMKSNIAKILEQQIKMNGNLKNHIKEANLRYKGLDYRLTALEA